MMVFSMYRYILCYANTYLNRLNSFQIARSIVISICFSFVIIQYLSFKLYNWEDIPAPIQTRLYRDRPITIDLQPYSLCHPRELQIENLTRFYHETYTNKQQEACFLIEDLNGGSWWSYVSHEFAEILSQLKSLGIQSNITYRSFPAHLEFDYKTNLRKYFLNACNLDENLPKEQQIPIVILLWNINRLSWYQMRSQWNDLLKTTRIRPMVFIDDLHFGTPGAFTNRQYLFESVAGEILSTYPYLFHNYYRNIPSTKITWLPHSASMLSFRSINRTAENLLFVSGANLLEWYPCRWLAFFLCRTRNDLVTCLKHPGYGNTMKTDSSYHYGGQRYFAYMKKYMFGLGTCQSVHYAIAKLFEIPANGLVLVTTDDMVPILASLNLRVNEHFLTVDCSTKTNLTKEIIRLKNLTTDHLFEIRRASQEMIFERHLSQHRAQLLHVRLLSQALMASSTAAEQDSRWQQWGRNCQKF